MNTLRGALLLCLWAGLWAPGIQAHGEIGDHVDDLKAHLAEYEQEVGDLLADVDGLLERYAQAGPDAVDAAQLVDWWEDVKVHGAIETNYVPVYASVWQGLIGVKEGIEQGRPLADLRAEQRALSRAMWQGLGAVKLAASLQGTQAGEQKTAGGPEQAVDAILLNLDRVIIQYAEGDADAAESLVHDTYANRFEGIEGELIEQDAALVEDLERDFNVSLPLALQDGSDMAAVKQIVAAMKDKLRTADTLLQQALANRKDVF